MKNLLIALFMIVSASSAFSAEIDARYMRTGFGTLFGEKTTDDLSEGTTNKYYADSLARSAVSAKSGSGLTYSSSTGEFDCTSASASDKGCLTSTDWSTFNGKQDALGFTPVANTTTVNGHALSSNVTVSASDVGLGNVTNDAQVKKAEYTTKSGILAATGAGTYSEVATAGAGDNGKVLMADSGETAGVKWASVPSAPTAHKESKTLVAQDITNQYVDLSVQCVSDSLITIVKGASAVAEGADYTLSVVSNKTRFTFSGDLATAGATPLAAGDVIYFQCTY